MLSFLVNLIPKDYRWEIGIKKVAYLIAKFGVGYATASLVTSGKLTTEQCNQIQTALTMVVAGGLEAAHDWAKVKWPEAKWL